MLHDAIRILCAAAGWKLPPAPEDGVYSFALEKDLEVRVFSPDGKDLFFQSVIANFSENTLQEDKELGRLLSISAVRARAFRSVLAMDENDRLILFDCFPFNKYDTDSLPLNMENFLNELEFWRAQVTKAYPAPEDDGSLFSLTRKRT